MVGSLECALYFGIKPLSKDRLNLNTGEYRLDIIMAELKRFDRYWQCGGCTDYKGRQGLTPDELSIGKDNFGMEAAMIKQQSSKRS